MYKNKFVESFNEAVSHLLGEDIADTKKIYIPVSVDYDLSLDEYEPGEEVLVEKWMEYKKIIASALKQLPMPNTEDSYEFTDIYEIQDFKIICVDNYHVAVSFRINTLLYPAYEESDAVIEAEGAVISDIMEQFGEEKLNDEIF